MTDRSYRRRAAALVVSLSALAACSQQPDERATETANGTVVSNDASRGATDAVAAEPENSSPTDGVAPDTDPTGGSAPTDGVEIIRFPPGGTAVTLAGALDGQQDKRYRFDAQAGQPARVALREGNEALAFNLYAPGSGPGGEALFRGSRQGSRYDAALPTSGSYLLQVYRMNAATGPARAGYRLSVSIEQPGDDAASTGLSGSPADNPKGAIATYYRALDRGDYRAAYDQWEGEGKASGKSFAAFRDGFAQTRSTSVDVGAPGRIEGAAGSLYVTIPVDVAATLRNGSRQRFTGSYVLRRVNDVDGSSAEDRRWHLHSASLKPTR